MTFDPWPSSLSLGFKRICTIEEVAAAYPLLDMVDHDNRRRIVSMSSTMVTMMTTQFVTVTLKNFYDDGDDDSGDRLTVTVMLKWSSRLPW